MSRIIGCRDLHVAELIADMPEGQPIYGEIKRVPGLISLSIDDSIEQNKFFSDDTVEQAFSKTSSKDVTIELGHISNELEGFITGKSYDSNGVLVQKGGDAPMEVALLFRAPKSRGGAFRYVCLYKGILVRSASEYATQEDGIESSNVNLTGAFTPLTCNDQLSATADSDDVKHSSIIANWFTQVYNGDTVVVEPPIPTRTKPTINGATNTSVNHGSSFNATNGVTATDTIDGNLTNVIQVIGSVNTQNSGVQKITYSVTNTANLTTTVERSITVGSAPEPEPEPEPTKK